MSLKHENEVLRLVLAMIVMAFDRCQDLQDVRPILIMDDGPLQGESVDVVETARKVLNNQPGQIAKLRQWFLDIKS